MSGIEDHRLVKSHYLLTNHTEILWSTTSLLLGLNQVCDLGDEKLSVIIKLMQGVTAKPLDGCRLVDSIKTLTMPQRSLRVYQILTKSLFKST